MTSHYCYPCEPLPVRHRPTLHEIELIVCAHAGLLPSELGRRTRRRRYVRARHIVFLLARQLNRKITLCDIAARFSMDHSTIIHGVHSLKCDIDQEPGLRETIEMLKNEIIKSHALN